MEPFDIGLDGEEIEALPGFDDLPAEPLKTKICRRKLTTKKLEGTTEFEVDKKIQGSSGPG